MKLIREWDSSGEHNFSDMIKVLEYSILTYYNSQKLNL